MTINEIGSGFIRSLGAKDAKAADRDGKDGKSGASVRSKKADSVGISAAGFALAAKASEIEARIVGGVYDDPSMAEEVARRLLDSGDLDLDA